VAYGPLQLLVIGFEGNRFRGEILPELERLKNAGVVRIIDMLLVRRDESGALTQVQASDLTWEEATAFGESLGTLAGFLEDGWAGAERGGLAGMAELMDGHLFDEEDAFRIEQVVREGTSVALVVFEHLWSIPLLEAVRRADGLPLLNTFVAPETLLARGELFDEPV
jgi:uncharacterized membrane protein